MFTLMLVVGVSFVFFGLKIEITKRKVNNDKNNEDEDIGIDIEIEKSVDILSERNVLRDKINKKTEQLESLVEYKNNKPEAFKDILAETLEAKENEDHGGNNGDFQNNSKRDEKIAFTMKGLESGLYSIEDACRRLNMEKGEVLLLKNIYKK